MSSADVPTGSIRDDSYVSRQAHKNEGIPVIADSDKIEDPIDANKADSNAQLGMSHLQIHIQLSLTPLDRDDADAIGKSNIINERTRHAGKPSGTYREPGDDEGLPDDTGRSATR